MQEFLDTNRQEYLARLQLMQQLISAELVNLQQGSTEASPEIATVAAALIEASARYMLAKEVFESWDKGPEGWYCPPWS